MQKIYLYKIDKNDGKERNLIQFFAFCLEHITK